MAAPISLRLDQDTRHRVERIARRKKVPPSHVLREAVTKWIEHEEESVSAYESIKDLIGTVRGGTKDVKTRPADGTLSGNTGDRFTALLQARRLKK